MRTGWNTWNDAWPITFAVFVPCHFVRMCGAQCRLYMSKNKVLHELHIRCIDHGGSCTWWSFVWSAWNRKSKRCNLNFLHVQMRLCKRNHDLEITVFVHFYFWKWESKMNSWWIQGWIGRWRSVWSDTDKGEKECQMWSLGGKWKHDKRTASVLETALVTNVRKNNVLWMHWVYKYTYVYAYTHVHIYIYIYICIHIQRMYVCMYIYIYR